jgi:uncharacterized protein YkwD
MFSCAKEDDGIYFDDNSTIIDTPVTYSDIENDILILVNDYRTSIGLSSLTRLSIVSNVANSHTEYMIETGQVSHDNFSNRAETLMNNAKAKSVAENVAYGYSTAQGVLNGWLNSPDHKKIIEGSSYTHFGISTDCNTKGRNYFTQIFIKK